MNSVCGVNSMGKLIMKTDIADQLFGIFNTVKYTNKHKKLSLMFTLDSLSCFQKAVMSKKKRKKKRRHEGKKEKVRQTWEGRTTQHQNK